ncbi:MAG: hypothetical protein HUK26_08600, partial [Duodenibacillus sp.]|nr:hypothetical protein [Duodenibacillus sp.]
AKIFGVQATGDARADAIADAIAAIEALERFLASLGLPSTMQGLGIRDKDHIGDIARHAMLYYRYEEAFKPLSYEELVAILQDCYAD